MNLLNYFGIQFILFGVLILTSYYSDFYISKPFTFTDLTATIISIAILIVMLTISNKLKNGLKPIRLINKIFLSVFAILSAILVIGVLIGEGQF